MAESLDRNLERADRLTRDIQVGLPARHAAVALLQAVLDKGQSLDAAFSEHLRRGTLTSLGPRDRALARAIAATALRRKGQIEAIFQGLLERPIKGRTGALQAIVLVAMTQILFMETPVHAVVNLAVHQCKRDRQARRFDGLVNAILRRVAETGPEIASAQDAPRLNTPDWLWERWSAAHGPDRARRIAEAHLSEAALDLTVKSGRNGWARRLDGLVLPTGSVRLRGRGRIEKLEGFDEGQWWVQDAAAALPARLLGNVAGKRVADLCAAPGGKTAQLAHAGAKVTAVDISKKRLAHLAGQPQAAEADGEAGGGRRHRVVAVRALRRGSARRAVLGHRDHQAPPRHPLSEAPVGHREAGRASGAPARPRRLAGAARGPPGLLHLLAGTGRG